MIAVEMLCPGSLLRLAGRPFHQRFFLCLDAYTRRLHIVRVLRSFLLEKAHVAVAPGKGFGPRDAYVRIGLLVEPERGRSSQSYLPTSQLFNN